MVDKQSIVKKAFYRIKKKIQNIVNNKQIIQKILMKKGKNVSGFVWKIEDANWILQIKRKELHSTKAKLNKLKI